MPSRPVVDVIDLTALEDDEDSDLENELRDDQGDYGEDDGDDDEDEGVMPAYITIPDEDSEEDITDASLDNYFNPTFPEEFDRETLALEDGITIAVGDTIELKHDLGNLPDRQSGDFLRVKAIIENVQTEEVRLRGYLLRRARYFGTQFEHRSGDEKKIKLNELVMIIDAKARDPRPPMIQGVVDVDPADVLRKRDCTITQAPYSIFSWRTPPPRIPRHITNDMRLEAKDYVFHHGRLVCRWVNIVFLTDKGKVYSGEARRVYRRECDQMPSATSSQIPGTPVARTYDEVQIVEHHNIGQASAKRPTLPLKGKIYSFGDAFCGVGGTSCGAERAGLSVRWGTDLDEKAVDAYAENFPGALPFEMNVHDLPEKMNTKDYKVDILHMSCPCCYWSMAHTSAGKNDEANIAALSTVGPTVKTLRPKVVSLEQAPGLIQKQANRKFWRQLLAQLLTEGYNVRYSVVDFSQFGLPQQRRRLLILAAKRGIPLPPFPKPTHGLPGSGLLPFVSVYDALEPLRRLDPLALRSDKYHQPNVRDVLNRPSVDDPQHQFVKCITTSGGGNVHWSGRRKYTPRELSLFQGFPIDFNFTGSSTEATKQIGNAYPPSVAELILLVCAQTLEAYENRLIDSEEEIDDLYRTLVVENDFVVPTPPNSPNSLFQQAQRPDMYLSKYKYLNRLKESKISRRQLELWGRIRAIHFRQRNTSERPRRRPAFWGFFDGSADEDMPGPSNSRRYRSRSSALGRDAQDEDDENTENVEPAHSGSPSKRARTDQQPVNKEDAFWRKYKGKTIKLD